MIIKRFVKALLISLLLIVTFLNFVNNVQADETTQNAGPAKIDNPIGVTDPNQIIGLVIKGFLGIAGSVALAMFVYGGLVWMTAMGTPDKVTKGKDIILWATIGLVVIFSAFALVNFVLNNVIGGISS